ncbi:MAG: ATP synthase subunit I [Lachnospiraceae bacterium]|nr:ATP synthase subunit I [Lachnospiraceae bacterium]
MGIKKTLRRLSSKPETRTMLELYVGIIIVAIIFLVIGLIFARPMWMYFVGVLGGVLGAAFQLYNMYDTIDRALSVDEGKARSYMTAKSMMRLILSAVIMVVAYMVGLPAFIGAILGLFSLKVAALINPIIKKVLPDFQ